MFLALLSRHRLTNATMQFKLDISRIQESEED
jgi:hypothetical protein